MANTASSMPAWRSPRAAKRAGTVAIVKSCGSTVVDLVPRDRCRHRGVGVAAHRVGRRHRVVAGVLVVVDEHGGGVTVLAPPRRRHVLRGAALDLAGERQGGQADVLEAVARVDAHVDVHPAAARRLRPADGAELVEHLVGDVGDAPDAVPAAVGHRVEVDAPLVGPLDVGAAGVPRVQLDGRHLHRPDHVGQLGHAQLVGVQAVAGERHPHGLQPRRGTVRDALLVHLLAAHAGREAVHHARPLAQRVDDAGADGEVVARQVELRGARRREVHAVRVGDPHRRSPTSSSIAGAVATAEPYRCAAGHSPIVARSTTGPVAAGCRRRARP